VYERKLALDAIMRQISRMGIRNEWNFEGIIKRENAAIGRKDRAVRNRVKGGGAGARAEAGQQRRLGHACDRTVHEGRDDR